MFATFLCTFLLLLFFGTFSYVYVLWKHYVLRVQKLYREAEVGAGAAERVGLHGGRHPYRIPNPVVDPESKDEETTEAIPDDKLEERVSHFETQIIAQLRNAAVETGKRVLAGDVKNAYGARHDSPGMGAAPMRPKEDPATLVCQVANKVQIATFVRGAEAFFVEEQLDRLLPERPLLEKNATFDTCGVVSSSGALLKSGLGAKIDSNDFVIRFNNAPSGRDKDDYSGGGDYERDVGSKTSLRIVNSQVVGKPQFKFLESQSLYADSPVLVWDPSRYGSSVSEWYSHPDYAFFETFFSRRLMRPSESLHLLRPSSLWSLWDWLQSHSKYPLLPNPPSSGFLGLAIAISHCRVVHVYEYVPSMRLTKRCHYYDAEENLGCYIGDWHPLAAEKLAAIAMNVADKKQVYSDGFLTIPGAPGLDCKT